MQFLQQLQWDQNNSWLLFISLHSLLYCTKLIWNEVQWGVTSTLCASYIQTHQLHFNVFDILSLLVFMYSSVRLRPLCAHGRWHQTDGGGDTVFRVWSESLTAQLRPRFHHIHWRQSHQSERRPLERLHGIYCMRINKKGIVGEPVIKVWQEKSHNKDVIC